MKKITEIAAILGEENEKRLKDSITDLIIKQVEEDLKDMSTFLIDFNDVFDDLRRDVEKEVKNKIAEMYMNKLGEMLESTFGRE